MDPTGMDAAAAATPAVVRPAAAIPTPREVMSGVDVRGLRLESRRSARRLSDVDLIARPGQFIAVLGATGTGKSTADAGWDPTALAWSLDLVALLVLAGAAGGAAVVGMRRV